MVAALSSQQFFHSSFDEAKRLLRSSGQRSVGGVRGEMLTQVEEEATKVRLCGAAPAGLGVARDRHRADHR